MSENSLTPAVVCPSVHNAAAISGAGPRGAEAWRMGAAPGSHRHVYTTIENGRSCPRLLGAETKDAACSVRLPRADRPVLHGTRALRLKGSNARASLIPGAAPASFGRSRREDPPLRGLRMASGGVLLSCNSCYYSRSASHLLHFV